jgi:hypothetical protein
VSAVASADDATLRPVGLVALSESTPAAPSVGPLGEVALWRIPDSASATARWVADAVTVITTRRLLTGWSLSYCFRTAALGRDIIAAQLKALGHPMDRKTVAAALVELTELGCLDRVGQLADWVDPSEPTAAKVNKSGSFVYSLRVTMRRIGDFVVDALTAAVSKEAWGNSPEARVRRCLKWAIKTARPGNRNAIGARLALRCSYFGLDSAKARAAMVEYQALVDQTGHEYEWDEAARTLRSAYRWRRVVKTHASTGPPTEPA